MSREFYEFGRFRLDVTRRALFCDGKPAPLSPKVFDTLLELVRRRGEVLSKDVLIAAVWPEVMVEDNSLARNISRLRKILGEHASDHEYIVTIPGTGYSFVAPVREGCASVDPAARTAAQPATKPADPGAVRIRRSLGFGLLLVTVATAAMLSMGFRQARPLPFEITRETRLTAAGSTLKAAISPDGRFIAHTAFVSGRESLCVRRASTLHDIEIVPPSPVRYGGVTFSPDSETIYYISRASGAESCVLYRVPVMGGNAQKVKESVESPVAFSPDGTRYAFMRESGPESSIIVAALDSGVERKLISRKLPDVLDYPAWSPDGRTIACTAFNSSMASPQGSAAHLVEVSTSDGAVRRISVQTWGFIRQLAWLRDGQGLVMSARDQDSGTFHVWYVSYPRGIGRQVTNGLNRQVGASVTADSRQIVTVEEATLSSVWRMRSADSPDRAQPVVSGPSDSVAPAWTPDGRIVFEQELHDHRSIWIVDADGNNPKQLTTSGNNYYPSISADGRMLAFNSDRNGGTGIWMMDISGENPRMVAKAGGDAVPFLSSDGTWIAFTAVGARQWSTLWRVSAGGGRAVELNDRLWRRPVISPDGKSIAGFYADGQLDTQKVPTSIAVIAAGGGQPWKVIPIPQSVLIAAGLRWTPDGTQVTYVDRHKDGANIWSLPLNGGAAHQVTHFRGDVIFSFDWSRDGKQLGFSRGMEARDVVLIQDARH